MKQLTCFLILIIACTRCSALNATLYGSFSGGFDYGNIIQNIISLFGGIFEFFVELEKAKLNLFLKGIIGITKLISGFLSLGSGIFFGIINGVVHFFTELSEYGLYAFLNIAENIAAFITSLFLNMNNGLLDLLLTIISTVLDIFGGILNVFIKAFGSFLPLIINLLVSLAGIITGIFGGIIDFFLSLEALKLEVITELLSNVTKIFLNFFLSLPKLDLSGLINAFTNYFKEVAEYMSDALSKIISALTNIPFPIIPVGASLADLKNILYQLRESIHNALQSILSGLPSLPNPSDLIENAIGNILVWFKNATGDLKNALTGVFQDFATSVIDAIKKACGLLFPTIATPTSVPIILQTSTTQVAPVTSLFPALNFG